MLRDGPNPNELEALRILWEGGELKPAEIQERFGWPIENATLRSVLISLVENGQADREARGKAFHYRATVPRNSVLRSAMHVLARAFAGGSHRALVAQLVETGDLTPEDLEVVRKAAAGASTTPNARRRKRS